MTVQSAPWQVICQQTSALRTVWLIMKPGKQSLCIASEINQMVGGVRWRMFPYDTVLGIVDPEEWL